MLKASLVEDSTSAEGREAVRSPVTERRRGVSDYELAERMLAHAVDYLVTEQLEGRSTLVKANREAVAILCEAGRTLERMERREPARNLIAGWLNKANLNRSGVNKKGI